MQSLWYIFTEITAREFGQHDWGISEEEAILLGIWVPGAYHSGGVGGEIGWRTRLYYGQKVHLSGSSGTGFHSFQQCEFSKQLDSKQFYHFFFPGYPPRYKTGERSRITPGRHQALWLWLCSSLPGERDIYGLRRHSLVPLPWAARGRS